MSNNSLPAGCRLVKLQAHSDERGSLISLEPRAVLPFEIGRAYYLFATRPGAERGFHAHRTLRQLAVAVHGKCTMVLDDGRRRTPVCLDSPDKGLLIGAMTWREMRDFTTDCVLLLLADSAYDEGDYIRDYAEFLCLAGAQGGIA